MAYYQRNLALDEFLSDSHNSVRVWTLLNLPFPLSVAHKNMPWLPVCLLVCTARYYHTLSIRCIAPVKLELVCKFANVSLCMVTFIPYFSQLKLLYLNPTNPTPSIAVRIYLLSCTCQTLFYKI